MKTGREAPLQRGLFCYSPLHDSESNMADCDTQEDFRMLNRFPHRRRRRYRESRTTTSSQDRTIPGATDRSGHCGTPKDNSDARLDECWCDGQGQLLRNAEGPPRGQIGRLPVWQTGSEIADHRAELGRPSASTKVGRTTRLSPSPASTERFPDRSRWRR